VGTALNWFLGSIVFLIVVLGFSGLMGMELGSNTLDDFSSVNGSRDFSIHKTVDFFTGVTLTWNEAPALISVLLLIPLISIVVSGAILILHGN